MFEFGIGIIGCGAISKSYLTLAQAFKNLNVRTVADMNMDAAESRASEFGVRAETVDQLLASRDVDLVVNLTPPKAHFDVNKAIILAGKHVYSEKPVALTLTEGVALQQLAAANEVRIGSGPDTWMGGAHYAARKAIDGGKLGALFSGTARVMSRGMESWHQAPDFFYQPGGGPILDLGPYYITNLVYFLGPVAEVAALSVTPSAQRIIGSGPRAGEKIPVGTPTTIHALLLFKRGISVALSASWDIWAHRGSIMELYGTEGSIFLADPNFFGGTTECVIGTGYAEDCNSAAHPFSVPNQVHNGKDRANYRCAGVAEMVHAIMEGRPHRCSMELALHVLEVLTGILRSGGTGKFVKMTTQCDRPDPVTAGIAQSLLR